MDQNPNSSRPHENLTSSSRYNKPPPSYSECIQLRPLTPSSVKPTSSISTVVPQDLPPPSSALPPNVAYVTAPYPTQQPTTINGLPSNGVITSAPTRTPVLRPNDYMVQSIVSLFSCCPLGFVALLFSLKTRSSIEKGDLQSAAKSSRIALILTRIAWLGILFYLLIPVIIYLVVSNQIIFTGPTDTTDPLDPSDYWP